MHCNKSVKFPVPRTNLFMKKMAKIQAIDRQIRKKWVKIKRDNQNQHLIPTDDQKLNFLKSRSIKNPPEIIFSPSKDHSHIQTVQSSLKRQKILSNHKKHEQIFYGRRKKTQQDYQNQNHESTKNNPLAKDVLSVYFDSPRRRIKTEAKIKNLESQKSRISIFYDGFKRRTSNQKSEQRKLFITSKGANANIKLPKMLLKRQPYKNREKQILSSQSDKELVQLSQKRNKNLRQRAKHRRDLFQKLQGSKAFYIMQGPLKLMEDQELYMV